MSLLHKIRKLVKPRKLKISYVVKAYSPDKNKQLELTSRAITPSKKEAQKQAHFYRQAGHEAMIEEIKIIDDGDIRSRYPYQGF